MMKIIRPAALAVALILSGALYGQAYVGVGVRIARDSISTGWWPYVNEILEGGTAAESDMQGWTWIKAVNGVSTNNLPIEQVTKMIVGPEGTSVTVQVDENGKLKDYTLVRRKLVNTDVLAFATPSLIPFRS
ncbi:MAG TPA: hypothetical protein VM871_10910, partial [Flavisolibacter sp.]|nr:hypothetical protein [Flavisolibacter sp.]